MSTVVSAMLRCDETMMIFTARIDCDGSYRCVWCGQVTGLGQYVWHNEYSEVMCETCAEPRRVTTPHVLGVDDV